MNRQRLLFLCTGNSARSQMAEAFLSQVQSSTPIAENQVRVEKINHWLEKLGKFIDDLPRLRDEAERDLQRSRILILKKP